MGTVNYKYAPNDTVWVITTINGCPSAVRTGIVSYVRINITSVTGSPTINTVILYDVLLDNDNGPTKFFEIDVFETLSDANTEYGNRLGSGSP